MTKSTIIGMAEFGVHYVKTHLSKLLRRVATGEEIVITRDGEAVARLVPVDGPQSRTLGLDAGRMEVPEDFNAPLPDEILTGFEAR